MSVYLDSLWQPIEQCTAFLIRDTYVSSDRIFFCKPCISWNCKKASRDCRTRCARKEASPPVSRLQSHVAWQHCGHSTVRADDERLARVWVSCEAKHGAVRRVTSTAPRSSLQTTAPAPDTLRFLFRIFMF
jgi:hypothetical protein